MPSVARSGEMGNERGESRFRDGTAGSPSLTKPQVPFLTNVLFLLAGTVLTLFVLLMLASRADAATSASSGKGGAASAGSGVSVGGVSVGANVSISDGGGAASANVSAGDGSAGGGASVSSGSASGSASVTTSRGTAGAHAGSSGASVDSDVARASVGANGTNVSGRVSTPAGGANVGGGNGPALPEPPLGGGDGNGGAGGGGGDATRPDRPGAHKPDASSGGGNPQPDRPASEEASRADRGSSVTASDQVRTGDPIARTRPSPPAAVPTAAFIASTAFVPASVTNVEAPASSSLASAPPFARVPHDRPSTSAGGALGWSVLDLQHVNGFLGGASLLLLTFFLAWLWASPRGPTPAPYLIPERPG